MKEQVKQLLQFIQDSNRDGANQLIENLLTEGATPKDVLIHVLDPAMIKIGQLWGQNAASLSETFVAAKIAEDILVLCTPKVQQHTEPKGVAVIGNIEDDFHSLGRRIVASFLSAAGWEVHDLGNDVLAEEFIDKALEVNAHIIGASAMMQTTALNVRKVRDLLDERGLSGQIKLAVGGAVFNWRPQLAEEVGADGTAANAAEVDALFMRLKTDLEAPA